MHNGHNEGWMHVVEEQEMWVKDGAQLYSASKCSACCENINIPTITTTCYTLTTTTNVGLDIIY